MSKKIKVIELITGIVDAGAETLVKNYVLGLDKNIFDVSLLVTTLPCSYSQSANVRELIDSGVKIYSPYPIVKSNIFNKIYRRLRRMLLPSIWIKRRADEYIEQVLLTSKPDIIHIHMRIGQLINIADKLSNVKLFYSCYSLPERYFNEGELKGELEAAKYLVAHNGLRFIAMHEDMRTELNRIFGVDNTLILRNTIDVSNFQNVSLPPKTLRKQLGIPEDAYVVGHVGRMFYIKNQIFLIDIFIELLRIRPNAFLLLVGEGEDKEKIIAKLVDNGLEGKYMILSNIDNLNHVYKAMDVFVFPSILEGLPNVCIEAQAAGLRCLISSAITKDVCLSDKAIQLDIKDDPIVWAKAIENNNIKGIKGSDISEYDLPEAVHNLETYYTI